MVRLKTRYLIVELDGPGKQKLSVKTKEDVTLIIRESVAKYYGDYGVGRTQYTYQVLYYSSHTRIGVVRCARELSRLVESSFFFVNGSAALEMRLRVVRECGT
ncbi:TPA: hypothetical protein N0F65_000289 [Lagenidium giganteum]|uniref:Uncharacterized protein n=1 Tax=Lagenidium giganteum TaxID=4803 RepID=A0AAV2Z8R1_9STRA|nr:TPA: hypothetical protein N0F65_000289 [Lagenidium giganteum]